MKYHTAISYAVQSKRENIPTLIRYMFTRALAVEVTLEVAAMQPWRQNKMEEELLRRIATLMLLDEYSATHPFEKEEVEIEPTYIPAAEIRSWWRRYRHVSPHLLADMIWAEVDL